MLPAWSGSKTLIALTRPVSPSITRCELTHLARIPIDHGIAQAQHREYERALETAGCTLRHLPEEPELPDAVFVEDTAFVLDEVAIIARPGAPTRRLETRSVAAALASYRPLLFIEEPGTLDGGDVLRMGRKVFVGLSARTTADAARQLASLLSPFGYTVHPVEIRGCLHLKTAVTCIDEGLLLINPEWVSADAFPGTSLVTVDEAEPFGANALRIRNAVLYPAELPRTRERLERKGLRVLPVPSSELAKAEGGVTCGSLVFEA
jgi:dimethylargininase